MATYDPYIKRAAGDFIAADDWNEIQRLGRQDLAEHDHTGGLKGPKLTGDAISPDTVLNVKRVNADEIKLGDRLLSTRLNTVEDVASKALSVKGGAIEGDLTIGGNLTVKGKINGGVSTGGGGGGATFAIANVRHTTLLEKANFAQIGLNVEITLTQTSIVSATANISYTGISDAEFAFVTMVQSSLALVPFVPNNYHLAEEAAAFEEKVEREIEMAEPRSTEEKAADILGSMSSSSATGRTPSIPTTTRSSYSQIDPSQHFRSLAAAAKAGDAGIGVAVKLDHTISKSYSIGFGFTQVTALPPGTYTVGLVMRGKAEIPNGTIFVVTHTADLSLFDGSR